jgi:hypothetical protein
VKFDPLNASASVAVAAYARQWLEERRHLVEMIRALRNSGKLAAKSIYNV